MFLTAQKSSDPDPLEGGNHELAAFVRKLNPIQNIGQCPETVELGGMDQRGLVFIEFLLLDHHHGDHLVISDLFSEPLAGLVVYADWAQNAWEDRTVKSRKDWHPFWKIGRGDYRPLRIDQQDPVALFFVQLQS